MADSNVPAQLLDIVAEAADVDLSAVTPEKSLRDDLELDSLATVDIATRIRDELGVKISDEDLAGLQTVADLIQYVGRHS